MTKYHIIVRTLKIVGHAAGYWNIAIVLVEVFLSVLPLASFYILKLVIDEVTTTHSASNERVLLYILAYATTLILIALLTSVNRFLDSGFNLKVQDYISALVINKSSRIPYHFYEDSRYFNSLHFVQRESIYRPTQLASALRGLMSNGLMLFSLSILFTTLHWSIGLILIVLAIPTGWVKYTFAKRMYEWKRSTQELRRRSGYFNLLLTTAEFAKEIRLFNLGDRFTQIYKDLQHRLLKQNIILNKKEGVATVSVDIVEKLVMVGLIFFILFKTAIGVLSVGSLVMYIQAMQKGQSTVKAFVQSLSTIFSHQLFVKQLFQFLDLNEEKISPSATPINQNGPEGMLQIEKLSFTYPNTDKEVLSDISAHFKKGQITAIVGENGSGKSTLIKLICGLFEPSAGELMYDNMSIRDLDKNIWYQQVGVIFQDFKKYDFDLAHNIHLYDQEVNNQRYDESIAVSETDVISGALHDGRLTQLGKSFKGGQELSQGQWQRIALARAIYKDSKIVILDEPTSAIDPLSEARIFDNLKIIARDIILILVTHRIYNLQMADQILVMDHGRIVQSGTHHELYAQSGLYKEMFNKQRVEA